VNSSCRKDNLDTNIPTALALSTMVILSILSDFTIIKLLKIVIILRGCSMATSILHSQNFRFQITIYLEGNWDFFNINTFM
jgi:hypothetical protein